MVTIGATGHRILTEIEMLHSGVEEVLRCIEQTFPGQAWMVISLLAEGADRLVVHRGLARPNTLLVAFVAPPVSDDLAACGSPECMPATASLVLRIPRHWELSTAG
jgi:hypothetical protein